MAPSRALALAESVLATLIWGSSFVVVKIGLAYIGPLTVAGLRFVLAAALMAPFALRRPGVLQAVPRELWRRLLLLGLLAYTIGNGAVFLGLKYLPATTVSFVMSLSPLAVLAISVVWLKEIPARLQLLGVLVTLAGSAIFFSPGFAGGEALGLGIVLVGLAGFTSFGLMGRQVARDRQTDTLTLTLVPQAAGGALLLAVAVLVEGVPRLTPAAWGIVAWLAVVNTALAYLLYNHSLQVLTALEMNIFLNLAPLGTAGLAWLLLGEALGPARLAGLVAVVGGVTLVQWRTPTAESKLVT